MILRRNVTRKVDHNLVIMGMGEPLANYDNLLKALRILNAPGGELARGKSRFPPAASRRRSASSRRAEQFRLAVCCTGRPTSTVENHAGEPQVSAQGIDCGVDYY
jgi:hypothetical protein